MYIEYSCVLWWQYVNVWKPLKTLHDIQLPFRCISVMLTEPPACGFDSCTLVTNCVESSCEFDQICNFATNPVLCMLMWAAKTWDLYVGVHARSRKILQGWVCIIWRHVAPPLHMSVPRILMHLSVDGLPVAEPLWSVVPRTLQSVQNA